MSLLFKKATVRNSEVQRTEAGQKCQQPEDKKPDAIGRHGADIDIEVKRDQVTRVKGLKKDATGDDRDDERWPQHRDRLLRSRYSVRGK